MTAAAAAADPATQPAAGDGDYMHVTSWWSHLLDAARIRVPRALCGASLIADPDEPVTGPDAPLCPRCLLRGGGPGTYVPAHWARYVTR